MHLSIFLSSLAAADRSGLVQARKYTNVVYALEK